MRKMERVLCENCFLMLILNFHVCILNEFHDDIMCGKKCFATLCFLKVCVMLLRNLILRLEIDTYSSIHGKSTRCEKMQTNYEVQKT